MAERQSATNVQSAFTELYSPQNSHTVSPTYCALQAMIEATLFRKCIVQAVFK